MLLLCNLKKINIRNTSRVLTCESLLSICIISLSTSVLPYKPSSIHIFKKCAT
jgi:hypothetical protein